METKKRLKSKNEIVGASQIGFAILHGEGGRKLSWNGNSEMACKCCGYLMASREELTEHEAQVAESE
jgi:hypothetical protein